MNGIGDWRYFTKKLMPIRYVGSFTAQNTFAIGLLAAERGPVEGCGNRLYTLPPLESYGSDGVSWTRRYFPGVAHVLWPSSSITMTRLGSLDVQNKISPSLFEGGVRDATERMRICASKLSQLLNRQCQPKTWSANRLNFAMHPVLQ